MTASHNASPSPSAGLWTGGLTDLRHAGLSCGSPAHHRHHAGDAGAVHWRDDRDLLHGLFADVEAPPGAGAGADRGAYTSAVKAGLDHMPANVPFYLDYSQNAKLVRELGLWTFFSDWSVTRSR